MFYKKSILDSAQHILLWFIDIWLTYDTMIAMFAIVMNNLIIQHNKERIFSICDVHKPYVDFMSVWWEWCGLNVVYQVGR